MPYLSTLKNLRKEIKNYVDRLCFNSTLSTSSWKVPSVNAIIKPIIILSIIFINSGRKLREASRKDPTQVKMIRIRKRKMSDEEGFLSSF